MARLAVSADEAGVAGLEVDELEPGTLVREAGRGALDGRGGSPPGFEHERRPRYRSGSVRRGQEVVEQRRGRLSTHE